MKLFFSVLLVVVCIAAGCASNSTTMSPQLPDALKAAQPEDLTGYKIASGDVLEITVFGEENLNRTGLVVRPDGKVSFPLVGDIEAGGHTTADVKEVLERKIREFIPTAVAAISIAQLGSLQYYVVGKVSKPGMFNVSKPVTVLQALALAGGLTPFADEGKIIIMRNFGNETSKLPFNYRKIKKGENIEQNVLLQRGDVVVVP